MAGEEAMHDSRPDPQASDLAIPDFARQGARNAARSSAWKASIAKGLARATNEKKGPDKRDPSHHVRCDARLSKRERPDLPIVL